ncbi:MAG: hypothetical protein HY236_13840 [Acidobacteria bacterium]|nr:hypothetical protein [Acidobacteriota bacterium]
MPSEPAKFGIAQGSLFVVFGLNLGPTQLQQSSSFPLPLRLGGSSVRVEVEGAQLDAIMIYTSAIQLAALLPSNTPTGNGTLTVTYNGIVSNPAPIKVVPSAFGIYTIAQNGRGPGVVTNPSYQVNSASFSANPGETLIIWGTGLGPVSGDEGAGPLPGSLGTDTQVFVGAKSARVEYAGRSGCCAGLDQIAFDVPPGVEGCFVPLAVRTGGVVSNFPSLSIAPQGRQCAEPAGVPVTAMTKAAAGGNLRVGAIALGQNDLIGAVESSIGLKETSAPLLTALDLMLWPGRTTAPATQQSSKELRERARQAIQHYKQDRRQGKPVRLNRQSVQRILAAPAEESVTAGFSSLRNISPLLSHLISTVSAVGACSVLTCGNLDCGLGSAIPLTPGNRGFGSALDAGPGLTLSGPSGPLAVPKVASGKYGATFPAIGPPGQLPPADYSVAGPGGADVGTFSAHLTVGAPLSWTNKDAISLVDRSQDLTVTWNRERVTGYVVVGGLFSSPVSGALEIFICGERSATGSVTIPSFVLSALPVDHSLSPSAPVLAKGYLFLAVHPLANTFTAPGLDLGYFSDFSLDMKRLLYQ